MPSRYRHPSASRAWHACWRWRIGCETLLQAGVVKDYATLARLGHVSRARICQIVSLLQLAPDIQEEILFLGCSEPDRGPLHLRQVRPIAAVLDWSQQRRLWRKLRPG